MSVPIQLGPEAFRFDSFEHWVNKAQSWFASRIPDRARLGRRYLCIDAAGRVCMIGADFMRARDEGTFPVVVYLIDSTPSVKVPGPTQLVGHVDMQSAGAGDRIKWTGCALPHGTPLYATPTAVALGAAPADLCEACSGTGADAGVTDEPRDLCGPCRGTGWADGVARSSGMPGTCNDRRENGNG
jgi:hypothetical protein